MSLELKNVEKKVGLDTHIYPTNLKLEKNAKIFEHSFRTTETLNRPGQDIDGLPKKNQKEKKKI